MRKEQDPITKATLNRRPYVRPAISDLGDVDRVTRGGEGQEPEDNIVWGGDLVVYVRRGE